MSIDRNEKAERIMIYIYSPYNQIQIYDNDESMSPEKLVTVGLSE